MEVYFKELISKDASLDKLVDDLERIVQGADDFAKSLEGTKYAEHPEIKQRVQRLKETCERINREIIQGAHATDRFVRKNPYYFLGGAMLVGLLVGARFSTRR
jgi:ElaB/YqjD/DUF883 family membrane-anchored ribosome-binding protein